MTDLFLCGSAWAAEPASAVSFKSEEAAERAKLFIALLKRRAQRVLEAHRAPPPPVFSASVGLSQGYESNVNLDGERLGDHFTEEAFSLLFRPNLTPWLTGNLSYDLLHTHYQELTDSNLWSNTFGGTLQVQPHQQIRLDLGVEYGILNSPRESDSSFADRRFQARLLWAQNSWLLHGVSWTYQRRDYDTRKVRDSGQNQIPELTRQDQRHRAVYELRMRFPETFVRLRGEFYRNFSNEQFQDFYDWEDVRLRGALTRLIRPEWIGTVAASYERKNYRKRNVPAINMAERDDLLTFAGALIYELTPRTSLSYSLTYRHQDSNDPRLDFTDWIHQVGATISF